MHECKSPCRICICLSEKIYNKKYGIPFLRILMRYKKLKLTLEAVISSLNQEKYT